MGRSGVESWKGVSRTELLGRRGESMAFHLRYFEILPGGHSSLEKHEHTHAVIAVKGKGQAEVGSRVWGMKPLDVCYTSPWEVHQFRCPKDAQESFGFFCIVDAVRDKPVLVDPNGREVTAASSCG